MATLTKRIITYSDGTFLVNTYPSVQWYQQREDREVFGSIRSCASCPAVFVMKDDPHTYMTKQWQYALYAANHNMTIDDVYLLLDKALAFANGTGFRQDDDPRADFFHNKDLDQRPPNLDKVRTTSRSLLTGVEQYNLATALGDVTALAKALVSRRVTSLAHAQHTFAEAVANTPNVLKVKVFDSRQNPPLKPGYSYPNDISEVDPDAYLYNPQDNPEMFLVANIVNRAGEVVQFPRGALYPWFEDGKTTASFVPHIANLAYGDILYPLRFLQKLPLGSPKPSPYRHNS